MTKRIVVKLEKQWLNENYGSHLWCMDYGNYLFETCLVTTSTGRVGWSTARVSYLVDIVLCADHSYFLVPHHLMYDYAFIDFHENITDLCLSYHFIILDLTYLWKGNLDFLGGLRYSYFGTQSSNFFSFYSLWLYLFVLYYHEAVSFPVFLVLALFYCQLLWCTLESWNFWICSIDNFFDFNFLSFFAACNM